MLETVNFKWEIENSASYTRLKTCFADMEAYIAFVAFVAQDFEVFFFFAIPKQ